MIPTPARLGRGVPAGRRRPCFRCVRWLRPWLGLAAAALGPAARAAAPAVDFVSRSWVTDDGLPHNVVLRVEQDRTGYVWLATMAGLARFDGQEFKVFTAPGRDSRRGRNVRDFALLPDGRVLFLSVAGGILQVDGERVSEHPASRALGDEPLLHLYVEPGGAIWVQAGQAIARWQDGRVQRFGEPDGINRRTLHFSWATDARGLTWVAGADFLGYYADGKLNRLTVPAGVVYRIAPACDGSIWVYGDGLYRCDGERLARVAGPAWEPARASARALYEDSTGVLWIGTSREGAFRYAQGAYTPVAGVESGIEAISGDREGDVWLATDGGGVRRLRNKSYTFVDAPVKSVCTTPDGTVWFAAMSAGLVRWADGRRDIYPLRVGRVPVHALVAAPNRDGQLWLGTTAGLFAVAANDPAHLRRIDGDARNVHLLFAAADGDMWVDGPARFGVYHEGKFNAAQPALAPGEDVTAIAQEPGGTVWLGTSHGNVYTSIDGRLRPAPLPAAARGGAIHSLLVERDGPVWLGTAEGLVWTDRTRVRRLNLANGLPDTVVLQLLEDGANDVWIATGRGVYRLARPDLAAALAHEGAQLHPVAYGPEQGLLGISPITNEQPAATVDAVGRLWFCTYKGGIGIDVTQVQHDEIAPPVLIKETRIDDRVVHPGGDVRVPSGDHALEFRFAALSYAAPERVRLRHRLEGYDTHWTDTAPDRIARYAKLPPGHYRLRVIAANGEGVWNTVGADLGVVSEPAWWQTPWFQLSVVIAFALLVGAVARYWSQRKLKARLERLEREHAMEQERARIARDMHDELGGSVTGINLTVQRLRDVGEAELPNLVEVLDGRVRRLTVELDRVVWTVSPKHGSLDQLATYIERFARNLLADTGVRCRMQGLGSIPALPVKPEVQHHVLAVTKESINNVLKHAAATEVLLTLSFAADEFGVAVTDNGRGFDPERGRNAERNGLRNMQQRIHELDGELTIESAPGQGTIVRFRVPVSVVVLS